MAVPRHGGDRSGVAEAHRFGREDCIAAALVAWFMTRLLARPVKEIRSTTHSLAAGNYSKRVTEPSIDELADLARDVNALADELESTEVSRAQLISNVTHELRTPLTSIDGYVEGAADGVFTNDEMLGSVTEETRRMRKLVDDLSLLSRAQEGSLVLERSDTDISRLANETAERLRPPAAQVLSTGAVWRVPRH